MSTLPKVFLPVCQDALKFPLVGSAVLFGLFITFKILPKNLVNLVLAGYFALLGVLALTATLLPFIERICSARVKKMSYTAPKFNVPSWLSKVYRRCISTCDNIMQAFNLVCTSLLSICVLPDLYKMQGIGCNSSLVQLLLRL